MKAPAYPRLGHVWLGLFFLTLLPPLATAQQSQQSSDAPGWPITNPDANHNHLTVNPIVGLQHPDLTPEKACSLWDVSDSNRPAVTTARLQVPAKAKGEYQKACNDVRHKKLGSAENHLHSAVSQYQSYADAWVLLGQVLEAKNQVDDAQSACSEAMHADSNYSSAYLCLADIAGQQKQWSQTLDMADRALAITSQDIYGYFYTAVAQFHLNRAAEAESNVLQTINADRSHRIPQAHVLLAQIYAGKNDLPEAAAQLRAYLKLAPNWPDAAQVRIKLAQLEAQLAK